MPSSLGKFVNSLSDSDNRDLKSYGLDPDSAETLPTYARWIRLDLATLIFIVDRATVVGGLLLALIAIPLWILALR